MSRRLAGDQIDRAGGGAAEALELVLGLEVDALGDVRRVRVDVGDVARRVTHAVVAVHRAGGAVVSSSGNVW
jgi:hypothetical protein